jgi:hypothetical protein
MDLKRADFCIRKCIKKAGLTLFSRGVDRSFRAV